MKTGVATTWSGRNGAVLLGPTESRVAAWLDDRTRHGRVTLRMVDLIAATRVERSEGYRIARTLRTLGLFGVEDDRSGQRGGRRWWRTARRHDVSGLDPDRHHRAWSRIRAWSLAGRARLLERIAALRQPSRPQGAASGIPGIGSRPDRPDPAPSRVGTVDFAAAMRKHGAGALLDAWRVR